MFTFKNLRVGKWVGALLACAIPGSVLASEGHGLGAEVWLLLAGMLLAAKLGGELAQRLNQPPVLGELLAGIVLGNLSMLGIHTFEHTTSLPAIEFASELGVVLLLFAVGLEATVTQMRQVAPVSGLVAMIGVVAPMLLGWGTSRVLLPEAPSTLHLFIGATLCATSVGITARVLKDLNATSRTETRVILGAAVIDDVLGLVVLAVVSAIAAFGTFPGAADTFRIIGSAAGFLVGALLLGAYVTPGVYRGASQLRTEGVLGAVSIALCFLFAGLSGLAGLAAIVGAFAAGLILDEIKVSPFGEHSIHQLEEFVTPIVAVFAPIFFVRTGMQVQLSGVTWVTLALALALVAAGVIGKLASGLGVRGQGVDRLTVGIGMIPRGEVGLIFADAGARIVTNGTPLIEPSIYTAIVLMVMATTVIAPPWLAMRLRSVIARGGDSQETAVSQTPPGHQHPHA